jgi:ADP-heptose:LPS heptosyltransferase
MLIRRIIYRIIGLYDRWAIKRPWDDAPHAISRILMIELTRIGDVLVTTPVVKSLRHKYPKAEITYVVQDCCKDIFRYNPHVDHVIAIASGKTPGPFMRALTVVRRCKPDLAVSLSPSLKNSLIAHFCRARYKVGYLTDHSLTPHFFKNHPIEVRGFASKKPIHYQRDEHLTVRAAKAVLPLNIACQDRTILFPVGSEAQSQAAEIIRTECLRIVIHPTSGWRFKTWPEGHFVSLISMIRSHCRHRPLQIILMGGHQDSQILTRINRSLDGRLTVVQGRPLAVAAAVIRDSDLFVGNDSGPLHMAEAFNVPFVGLFGPSLPITAGPLSPGIFISEKTACAPCAQTRCEMAERGETTCMEQIDVETVFKAVLDIIEK